MLSPDGRLLAFAACLGLYACDLHVLPLSADLRPEGPPRQLTKERTHIGGMTWAPDARSLIYAAEPEGSPWLWRVPASGAAPPERIELAGPQASSPTASRAVNQLAFSRIANSDPDIWKLDIGGRPEPLIASTRVDSNPQFSPAT